MCVQCTCALPQIFGAVPDCCSECGRSRDTFPSNDFNGSYRMKYLPLLPRIVSLLQEEQSYKLLYEHFQHHDDNPNSITDFFDTEAFRRIAEEHGGKQAVCRDIFISVSTDGFEPYKNNSYNVWPIVATLINFPTDYRYLIRNVIPLAFIPGPTQPSNLRL